MKRGNRSKRRRQPAIRPATGSFQSDTMLPEQAYNHDLQQSFSDLLESIGATGSVSLIQPWPSSNDVAMRHKDVNSISHVSASSVFGDPFWIDAAANGNADTGSNETMSPMGHDSFANAYLETLDDTISSLSNTDFSHAINSEPSIAMNSLSSSTSPTTPNKNTTLSQPQTSSGSGPHDCYMIANTTLAMLHVSSQPISNNTSSDAVSTLSPDLTTYAPMQTAQHLDEVLRCTREAMDSVFQLLRCPCAGDPQMATLYASIVIRILFWHQLAAGVKTSTSMPLSSWDESQSTDLANRSHRSSCSRPTTFVVAKPIKLGNYVPNEDDQEPMRQLLLLIGLKKLGRLVEIYTQVRDPVEAGPSQIRGVLASWLNSELHQAIKAVKEGAKAAVGQQSWGGG